MSMKGGVGEAFPVILAEKLAVAQADVVDLVSRAASVRSLPLLWRKLAFPRRRIHTKVSKVSRLHRV